MKTFRKQLNDSITDPNFNVTQQQLSKIENGINCNIITFLKVCNALGLDFNFTPKIPS